jgi:hypothetical protein
VWDQPYFICSSDLDWDGDIDLAVANFNSDNVSILLNNSSDAPSVALQCPEDILVPAFTDNPCLLLPGFEITNISATDLSYDYFLMANGPASLSDNGDPASISGTTPLLSPGESFSPPVPVLLLVPLREYTVEKIVHVVTAVGYPGYSKSCAMTVTIEAPVATLLQSCSAAVEERSVSLKWTLSEISGDVQWFILRAADAGGLFDELDTPEISGENPSFAFRDTSCEPGGTYSYRVEFLEGSNRRILFETEPIIIPAIPLTLFQNHPNPFNPSTVIRYHLPEKCPVRLEIYDVSGRCIASLVNAEQERGDYSAEWAGKDDMGDKVASGIYFYRLVAGKDVISKKMVLLR